MAVRLVVRRSSEAEAAEAFSYEFEQARVVIGRSPGADVRLPELGVSGHHATLERSGVSYSVRDEASTNGTRAGGVELVAARPRELSHGDLIEVGPFSITFELGPVRASVTPQERTASLARRILRDLLGPGHAASLPPRIVVVEGADAGLSVRLADPPSSLVIGRDGASGLALNESGASRSHVELTRDADGTTARDLGSKNGLAINGKSVRERRLKHGDTLQLGHSVLVYEDPAERAIKELDGQADVPITRTQQASKSARPVDQVTKDEPQRPAEPAPERSSVDAAVYALSALLLLASLAGLIWLFA